MSSAPSLQTLSNAIRALSMDAVQRAQSGHPGMPMGMADIATILWREFLSHNPEDPHWFNRDRFMLSNGHGSMLQYSLLHLTGYPLTMEDIKQFRQLHSKTPGHPEVHETPGIETTTGPLGQGLANAVGMALAERTLAAHFNRPDHNIIDHHTYVFLGDGCLMEGISHEACAFAGTQKLNKLIAFWDDNGISIDGDVSGWMTDDTPARFASYHWQVIANVDGHDFAAIRAAIIKAQQETSRPTLICCRTQIGHGAPNVAGSALAHGAPLGAAEVALTRQHLNWPHEPFVIPPEIYAAWDAKAQGRARMQTWEQQFTAYKKAFPELATELQRRLRGEFPQGWEQEANNWLLAKQGAPQLIATRKASQQCLNVLGPYFPELIGGSADLSESNLTIWSGSKPISAQTPDGNYLYYGVREFAMSAIMNGIALHGGFIPYGGTFLVFCDYARNAVRLAALMKQRVIFVYTHDSIGLGEDGPTHQPIEHLAMLRLTPNMSVWRPCDAIETMVAWQVALKRETDSTCLALSRQPVIQAARTTEMIAHIEKGGYILVEPAQAPQAILIATGSEITLALEAAQQLALESIFVRVVSMPSVDAFEHQTQIYRDSVLPAHLKKRVVIEAGVTGLWWRYAGTEGYVIGIDQFGLSAPASQVYEAMGLTVSHIVAKVKEMFE